MNSSYLRIVILFCIFQFKGERTVSAIYHLLKGKKSSQTIQDGKLFKLSQLFSLFPKISRQLVIDACKDLFENDYIELITEKHYLLTPKGMSLLNEQLNHKPIPLQLNGWMYGDLGRVFWSRLSLLVQVLSNFAIDRSAYLPVTKNQEDLLWVKRYISQTQYSKNKLIDYFYEDIKITLLTHSDKEAKHFVQRLTSSHKIGKTFEQIAMKENEDPIYIYLSFWNVIHGVISRLLSGENKYIIFNELITDKRQENTLTASTAMTQSYLLKGLSLPEIALIRKLKESTIEDHIVEITLHDNFSPDSFLSLEEKKKINDAIDHLETHQLKLVKDYLNHKYSYFQIRLTYALKGRNG